MGKGTWQPGTLVLRPPSPPTNKGLPVSGEVGSPANLCRCLLQYFTGKKTNMDVISLDEFTLSVGAGGQKAHAAVLSYIPVHYGSLAALVDVEFGNGWVLREVRYFREKNSERIEPPTRMIGVGREFWLVNFADFEHQQAFQIEVLRAIHDFLKGTDECV